MEKIGQKYKLYGWDDGKIYFWDEEEKIEKCVNDDKELYDLLLNICIDYFKNKRGKRNEQKD